MNNSKGIKLKEQSERDEWERLRHKDYLQALNSISEEIRAHYHRSKIDERGKNFREKATTWMVLGTLIFTGGADVIFYQTMKEARQATEKAHADSVAALDNADWDSKLAMIGAGVSGNYAFKQANAAAKSQHFDTLAALSRASDANRISEKTAQRQLRAYLSVTPLRVFLKDGWVYIEMTIHNAGQTPAKGMQINGGYVSDSLATNKNLLNIQNRLFRTNSSNQVDIFPGVDRFNEFPTGIRAENLNIIPVEYIEYILGSVTYKDIFGLDRRTKFCIILKEKNFHDISTGKIVDFDWCAGVYNRTS